jgi:hypothetical protein
MRRHLGRTSLLLGLLLATPLSAVANPHPRVVGGDITADYPAVGEVIYSACGATLIGCETVLTAAHCALGDPSVFMRHLFFQHAGMIDVDLARSTIDFGYDLAVLKLVSPVTRIRPLMTNRSTGSYSAPGAVVGWGCDPVLEEGDKIKRSADTTVSNLSINAIQAPVGGCSGDSGGAFLADLGAGTVLAGVVHGSYMGGVEGPGTYYYQSLIAQAAGSDLHGDACGTGAQAGDPNSTTFAFSGSIDAGTPQQTHTFAVPAGTTELRIAFNEEDNFNAYVRFGAPPTPTLYDCRIDYNVAVSLSCTIPSPQAGTYYAQVNRVSGQGLYQLTATTFSDCSDPINAGIACNDGNPCTANDVCTSLACAGSVVADATSCPVYDNAECTTGGSCQAGVCEPTTVVDGTACTPPGQVTAVGTCRSGDCYSACPPSPRLGCLNPEKSKFSITNNDDPARRKLQWTWLHGEAFEPEDLGDPTADTEYALCVYSASGQLRLSAGLPAGSLWRAQGDSPARGYSFKDPFATYFGMSKAQIASGAEGRTKAKVRGGGAALPAMSLPLVGPPELTVQLLANDEGLQCWGAEYTEAVRNDGRILTLSLP